MLLCIDLFFSTLWVLNKRLPFFLIIICFDALYYRAEGGKDGPSMVSSLVIDDMTNMIRELEQELRNLSKVATNNRGMAVAAEQEQVQYAEHCMAHIGRLTEEVFFLENTQEVCVSIY